MAKQMAKYKHNKKQNTAFLYEALILELTKSILKNDMIVKKRIFNLVKESFNHQTLMYRDLKLYHSLTQTKNIHPVTAEKILSEVKRMKREINQKDLLKEQSTLTRQIKKILSSDVLENFVPNYKNFATIAQIFNHKASIKTRVLLEHKIITQMIGDETTAENAKMVPIDNIIYKVFTNKFNNEYAKGLLDEQKDLLNKYVNSFSNNGLDLKLYLNEEIGRLKKEINKSLLIEEFVKDMQMQEKAKTILSTLNSYKEQKPKKEMIQQVMKIQSLVNEIRSNAN